MATKPQAKAAVDAACTDLKADIDNLLPVGVNIKDGNISFGPTRYILILDAGGSSATAFSWFNSIDAALTAANRAHTTRRRDRRIDPENPDVEKQLMITENKLRIIITNF